MYPLIIAALLLILLGSWLLSVRHKLSYWMKTLAAP